MEIQYLILMLDGNNFEMAAKLYKTSMVSNMNPQTVPCKAEATTVFSLFPPSVCRGGAAKPPLTLHLYPALHRKCWSHCPVGLPKRTCFILPGEMGDMGFQGLSPGNTGRWANFLDLEDITYKVRWLCNVALI